MKAYKILSIGVLLLLTSITVKAQDNEKRTYFFTMATAYIDGEGKKVIITNVSSTTCHYLSGTLSISIENQLSDYLKSEYKYWHKYSKQAFATYRSKAEAERQRIKYIGKYKNDNYTVMKDIHFAYYCK